MTLIVCMVVGCNAGSDKVDAKPNIMIWVADDQYLESVGCFGGDPVQTPNIDHFAKEGMRFTRAYSTSSICTPARSALYTGMYPIRNGAHPNHSGLKKDVPSMPTIMKGLGYRCGLVGKEGVHRRPTRPNNTFVWDAHFPHIGEPVQGAEWGEKVARKHKDIDYAGVNKFVAEGEQPFCLFVAASLPHSPPLTKIANGLEGYPANNWTADDQFGRFLKMLDDAGKKDNTVVIYLSDNGSNTPFSKYTLYEPGVRVPMIIRWPGHTRPGSISDNLVDFTDILPTIMEIAGSTSTQHMDGLSLVPLLKGDEKPVRDDCFLSFTALGVNFIYKPYPIRALVNDRYKLIHNINSSIGHPKGANFQKTATEFELYDLIDDPSEEKNLAYVKEYELIKNDLLARLNAWQQKVGDRGLETEMEALDMFPDRLDGKVQLSN